MGCCPLGKYDHFALQDSLLWEQLSFVDVILQANLFFTLVHPGKLSEMKSTWSPGPISHSQASLSHELWKVPQGPRSTNTAPSRPPPGLTNTKPSSTWGGSSLGLAQGWSSSYTTGGLIVKYLGLNVTGLTQQSNWAPSVKAVTFEPFHISFCKHFVFKSRR